MPELVAAVAQSSKNTVEFDQVDNVRWNDVTLGDLASQMGGIARDGLPEYL